MRCNGCTVPAQSLRQLLPHSVGTEPAFLPSTSSESCQSLNPGRERVEQDTSAAMSTLTSMVLFAGRERVEQMLAFGASRHEAGQVVVKAGVRAALQRLMQHTGSPGLLLLPALAAGLLLAGVPPMLVR